MKYIKGIILLAVMLIALGVSSVYAAKGSVTMDGVRIRKEPNTDSEIVTVLNQSAPVEIIEETGDWYKIEYDGQTGKYEGYMRKDFIKRQDEGSIPNTTQTPTPEPTVEPTQEPTPSETVTPEPTQIPSSEPPQEEEPKVELLGEKKINNEAKVYVLPTMTASIKDTIAKDTTITVQDVAGKFIYIKYNNGNGWIRTSALQEATQPSTGEPPASTTNDTRERKGYINVNSAIVRKQATTSSEMISSLTLNAEVTIIGEENDFYKIKINGGEYFIAKFLVSNEKQQTNRSTSSRAEQQITAQSEATEAKEEPTPVATTPVPTSSVGEQLASTAKSYLGYKYVYGGANPATGFDCSGFVYYICGKLGYAVNRTADAQVNNGVKVEKSDLQPGDLVFFSNYKTYTGIGHVGIYIGNNQFVHASTATTGVIISSLDEATYVKRYVTARRIGV